MGTFNKIGVIGAMDVEVDGLKNLMTDVTVERVSNVDFYSGKICGKDVVVARCGIGKVFAAICAEAMILKYGVDALINTGVAGTVSKARIKDVIVADSVVQYDMDTSAFGDPIGMISGINVTYFETDTRLSSAAKSVADKLGYTAYNGIVATGDRFVDDKEFKNYLKESFNASCVEMEGGAIGHTAYVNGVPFLVLRTISDGDGATEDYNAFVTDAANRSVKLIFECIKEL